MNRKTATVSQSKLHLKVARMRFQRGPCLREHSQTSQIKRCDILSTRSPQPIPQAKNFSTNARRRPSFCFTENTRSHLYFVQHVQQSSKTFCFQQRTLMKISNRQIRGTVTKQNSLSLHPSVTKLPFISFLSDPRTTKLKLSIFQRFLQHKVSSSAHLGKILPSKTNSQPIKDFYNTTFPRQRTFATTTTQPSSNDSPPSQQQVELSESQKTDTTTPEDENALELHQFLISIAPPEIPREAISKVQKILHENWYTSVDSLQGLTAQDANAISLPLRFLKMIQENLATWQAKKKKNEFKSKKRVGALLKEQGAEGEGQDEETEEGESLEDTEKRPKLNTKLFAETRVTKRGHSGERYGLEEVPPRLKNELQQFLKWMTTSSFSEQESKIQKVTAENYVDALQRYFGYLFNIKNHNLDELSIYAIFPKDERQYVQPIFDYLEWHSERGTAASTLTFFGKSFIKLAKFCFHQQSKADVLRGDKPFGDIEIVTELRKIVKIQKKKEKTQAPIVSEDKKWLDWPEYLEVVKKLELEVKHLIHPPSSDMSDKTKKEQAHRLQVYLIFALLASIPDRQRTLRELQLGKTLNKNSTTNQYSINHTAQDYKTGSTYGNRPQLLIPTSLTPYLDSFISHWRGFLNPSHQFLFSCTNGKPPDRNFLYHNFRRTVFRFTQKKLNPHLVRDSIVTHVRSQPSVSERELDALALYMGHSVKIQRSSYDQRTIQQKVLPAIDLIEKLNKN